MNNLPESSFPTDEEVISPRLGIEKPRFGVYPDLVDPKTLRRVELLNTIFYASSAISYWTKGEIEDQVQIYQQAANLPLDINNPAHLYLKEFSNDTRKLDGIFLRIDDLVFFEQILDPETDFGDFSYSIISRIEEIPNEEDREKIREALESNEVDRGYITSFFEPEAITNQVYGLANQLLGLEGTNPIYQSLQAENPDPALLAKMLGNLGRFNHDIKNPLAVFNISSQINSRQDVRPSTLATSLEQLAVINHQMLKTMVYAESVELFLQSEMGKDAISLERVNNMLNNLGLYSKLLGIDFSVSDLSNTTGSETFIWSMPSLYSLLDNVMQNVNRVYEKMGNEGLSFEKVLKVVIESPQPNLIRYRFINSGSFPEDLIDSATGGVVFKEGKSSHGGKGIAMAKLQQELKNYNINLTGSNFEEDGNSFAQVVVDIPLT